MSRPRILIVHPDPSSLAVLSSMLTRLGHEIDEAADGHLAARQMERGDVDVVLAAADPCDPEAMGLLAYVRREHSRVPVILLFKGPNAERSGEALRLGACSVLCQPVPAAELRSAVTQALGGVGPTAWPEPGPAVDRPASSLVPAQPAQHTGAGPGSSSGRRGGHTNVQAAPEDPLSRAARAARDLGLVGSDPALRLVIELAGAIAPTRTPVLIVGERGTGKSLLARMIHNLGPGADRPFVTVACAVPVRVGTPEQSALCGTDSGSVWQSELTPARGGTLFLDDVTGLADALERHLPRAIQEGEHSDVRFLMSSSESLDALGGRGRFRVDLYHYYRASVACLRIPPLRDRRGDVERIAESCRARFSLECGKDIVGFTRDALEFLNGHDWPGNVRELEGVIRRGVALCQGARITSGYLSPGFAPRTQERGAIRPLREALWEPEKRAIVQALRALNWNRQETARVLDINRTTLYKKMKKYGLQVGGPVWAE